MARDRHHGKNSTAPQRIAHEEKLRRLSHAGIQVDPTDRRATARAFVKWQNSKHVPRDLERRADKPTRDELKHHGYYVTKRGVVIDGPRDSRRKPIKGSRVRVMKGGVIKTSVGQRRDIIYGFTKKEKRAFAKDPEGFTKSKLAELMSRFPVLRGKKKQVRLQWGAYRATKDFSPNYFNTKYLTTPSPEEIRRVGKKKARPRADKLTGLHIVVHVPKKKGNRKHGRKKK